MQQSQLAYEDEEEEQEPGLGASGVWPRPFLPGSEEECDEVDLDDEEDDEPDLDDYFDHFDLPRAERIAICRAYANMLSALERATKKAALGARGSPE